MYEVLSLTLSKADMGANMGYAIIYESVKTIAKIYPYPPLLEQAAMNISRLIGSDNHNLKYLGITGLTMVVQVDPSYAAQHQMIVVDCLEDPDETLKRNTLGLLFRMSNPQNIEVVVDKMIHHLRTSVDSDLRRELVTRLMELCERFAPSNEWYLRTMNTIFELGGDLVPPSAAHNLMRLIAEGVGDDVSDHQFRVLAVNTYVKLLEEYSSLHELFIFLSGPE